MDLQRKILLTVMVAGFAGGTLAEARDMFLWRRSKVTVRLPRPKATAIKMTDVTELFPIVQPDDSPAEENPRPRDNEGVHGSRACFDDDFFEPVEVAEVSSGIGDVSGRDYKDYVPEAVEMVSKPSRPSVPSADNPQMIFGASQVDHEVMARFVASRNKSFDPRIARAFHEIGERYGIRGDIALCQAIIETGWFKFDSGTAVRPSQHNYCGLGVLKKGMRGHSFRSVEEGVTAQIQHLFAYASKEGLPKGEKVVDPRFDLVKRGCATTWSELSNRWAANKAYGESIMNLYKKLLEFKDL